jgi:hypothetical protein
MPLWYSEVFKILIVRDFSRCLMVFVTICIQSQFIQGQNMLPEIVQKLKQSEFENIRVMGVNKTLTISYENNICRDKAIALSEVIRLLSDSGQYDSLQIVTLVNDIPQVLTQLNIQDWKRYHIEKPDAGEKIGGVSISYRTNHAWKTLRKEVPVQSHLNKFDLVFYPQVALKNVLFSPIYELQFNVAPALEVSLWQGMKFTGQVIFPVYNHWLYGETGDKIRAGFVSVVQEFHISGTILGRAALGKFNNERYGADLSLTHYLLAGRSYLKMNAGYTGVYQYQRNQGWYRNNLNTLTYIIKAGYYEPKLDVQLDGSVGKYLNGDYGVRGDCTRYWGETAIGFFASISDDRKFNGGFHFTVPIGARHLKKNRSFQMRLPSYFAWEYNAGTNSHDGQIYKTQPNENRVEQFYNPNSIIKNLLQ